MRRPSLADIDAVLVTHDHSDHGGHAAALGRPLYATAGTRQALSLEATRVLAGESFTVGALRVLAGALAARRGRDGRLRPLRRQLARSASSPTAATTRPRWPQAYAGCDVLVLECNHDVTMLRYGPYPPSLKRRVGGRLGHLSNDQAASLLEHDAAGGPAAEAGDRRAPVAGQQSRRAGQERARSRARPRRARHRRHRAAARPSSPSRAAACATSPRATSSSALHSRHCNASCMPDDD